MLLGLSGNFAIQVGIDLRFDLFLGVVLEALGQLAQVFAPLEAMNNYGSSLIWGHPQGPTGMRLIIELIEELVLLGDGYGLFTGCAAGDTAAAVVIVH